jgi:predicted enzyme related to lactoylglutathione lyase
VRPTFRGIGVDKIDKHIEAFKDAGGREVVGKMEVPAMGWSFIGADPEGNLIALFETAAAPRRSTKRKKKK